MLTDEFGMAGGPEWDFFKHYSMERIPTRVTMVDGTIIDGHLQRWWEEDEIVGVQQLVLHHGPDSTIMFEGDSLNPEVAKIEGFG